MRNEEAFIKTISKELKQIKDRAINLQRLLNQNDINCLFVHNRQKKRIKPLLPTKLPNTHYNPIIHAELSLPNTHFKQKKQLRIVNQHKFGNIGLKTNNAFNLLSRVPMKTISTFNTTRSINPRLPSAIQAKREEEYRKLPYTIKRLNRNYHIVNNQLIVQNLTSDICQASLTERQIYNIESVSLRNPTPQKVKEYCFHKSLKLKGAKLFTRNRINSNLTSELRPNQTITNELNIIYFNKGK